MRKTSDFRWIAAREFMKAQEQEFTLGKLDRLSREFLDWIVLRCQSNEPLHIQEIVMGSAIASPATVHKCVDTLYHEKLIDLTIDKSDHRRRIVRPTALALRELTALDAAFQGWLKKQD
ncbi:hypothetical protein AOB54_02860 [beta proteobacterium MWH-UniP1]